MVKIIADILFEEELDKYLDDAYDQYGQKCVDHWQKGYEGIIKRLMLFPESYPPVNELKGIGLLLRGAILMNNFKIIYHYDESEETISTCTVEAFHRFISFLHTKKQRLLFRNLHFGNSGYENVHPIIKNK